MATGTSRSGAHLQAVTELGAGSLNPSQWAVGQYSGTAALQTLSLRDTGAGWGELAGANSATDRINVLHGVAPKAHDEAWAVGYHESSSFVRRTMVQHYQDGHWTIVASPNPTANAADLLDVIVTGPGQPWAVGYFTNGSGVQRVLVESWRC